MKVGFKKSLNQKTDKELEIIAKDSAFYSPAERLLALSELKARNSLTEELAETKEIIESSPEAPIIEITPQAREALKSGKKIYREQAVWSAIMGGGPLVGGYILIQNYKTFGEPEKAKEVWKFTYIPVFKGLGNGDHLRFRNV
jgi:hypothetical protein